MAKFKLGDKVRCIEGNPKEVCGAGWILGKEFIVGEVSDGARNCYYPIGRSGVYEEFLELVHSDSLKDEWWDYNK